MWEYNDELYHYGVLGMKWGRRRYQNKDGTLTPTGRSRLLNSARKYERKANTSVANNYIAKSRKAKLTQRAKEARAEVKRSDLAKARIKSQQANVKRKKSVRDMSDSELREKISRLELEKKYSELSKSQKQVSKGRKFVEDVITSSGRNIATQATTYALGTMLNKAAGNNIVNPKKGQKDK